MRLTACGFLDPPSYPFCRSAYCSHPAAPGPPPHPEGSSPFLDSHCYPRGPKGAVLEVRTVAKKALSISTSSAHLPLFHRVPSSSSTQQLGFCEWNKCATAPSCEEESGERFRAVLQHGASAGHCPQHRALPAAPCTACSTEHYPQHHAFPAAPFSTCSTAHGSPCSARSAMNCVLLCVHCVPPMPCTACSAMHGPHAVLPAAACTAQGRLQRAERCSLCSCPHCRHAAALERSCSGRTKGQFPPTPALCSELISPLPISTFSA